MPDFRLRTGSTYKISCLIIYLMLSGPYPWGRFLCFGLVFILRVDVNAGVLGSICGLTQTPLRNATVIGKITAFLRPLFSLKPALWILKCEKNTQGAFTCSASVFICNLWEAAAVKRHLLLSIVCKKSLKWQHILHFYCYS